MGAKAAIVDEAKDVSSTKDSPAKEVGSKTENGEENESRKKSSPYPWHVAFILGNEVCERYSFYGMNSILSIYLKDKLLYSENGATMIVHTFMFLCHFTPLFGAGLADQFLGKFKTIIYLSCVYVVGHIIKTVGTMTSYPSIPHNELSLLGLFIIAVGTGGIKPCVAAFAGDQFKLPEQARELQRFFSIFYMSINMGSLLSMLIGPELRSVSCMGEKDCYPLAFGIPALLMFIATVIIIIGKPFYKIKPTDGVVSKSFGIIWKGLTGCCQKKEGKSSGHCLDAAKENYEEDLVEEIKFLTGVNGILLLFVPILFFWCLFDQTATTWTYQAEHMYGLKGDQAQFFNPALILIFVPIFDFIIYPTLAKFNLLVKPLQRMSVGMFLTALAFLISGILELIIQSYPDKSLTVWWQLPQYIVLTCAEVMVSITGLEFAYSQAAPSMKSILQACWLLTVAFGNVLTLIITAIGDFEDRALGIFIYTGFMLLFSFIFTFLAWRYVPRDVIVKAEANIKPSDDFEEL